MTNKLNIDLLPYYSKFKNESESFYLSGFLNDDITLLLSQINTIKKQESKGFSKRVSYLTIETFQNIVRHGYEDSISQKEGKIKKGMFCFVRNKEGIVLGTVNQILTSKTLHLAQQINHLNQLNSDELKEQYTQSLLKSGRTEGGGAGIGLLSIIRKTKGKILYKIKPINDKLSHFIFQSNLMLFKEIEPKFITEDRFNFMEDNNLLLFRKGEFDHSSMVLITNLLNLNLKLNIESEFGKKLFFGVGEMIQNIYNHGCEYDGGQNGIFLVKKNKEILTLCSGNFIKNDSVDKVKSYLDLLNSLSQNELQELYIKKLNSPIEFGKEIFNSGIGLIEIKKHIDTKLNYEIVKVDNNVSFLTININYKANL